MLEFELNDDVAVLKIDDGKANAVSHDFIEALTHGLDRARADAKAVLIVGRPGRFCAGFDLSIIREGGEATANLLAAGCGMLKAVYTHPQPVVIACTGHALAAGALLLLTADSRIGAAGDFKIGLNETAIGMTLPPFALALAEDRISRRHLTSATVQAEIYDPMGAVDAGYLDAVVEDDDLLSTALAEAQKLADLPGEAYAQTKTRLRQAVAERMTT